VSVDAADYRTYEWKPFWPGWFSPKFRGPGLRYEIALCIRTGDIVWSNGPFPCGRYPDIKIFRRDLIFELEDGEVEADLGYRGETQYVKTPQPGNDVQARVQEQHETVNKCFKQWNCLSRVFRHQLERHQVVFGAVAVITQLALENGEPLFDVHEYLDR
jgi:hypothetical protein